MSAVVLTAAESIKVEFEPSDPGPIQHRLERVTSNLAAIHPDDYYLSHRLLFGQCDGLNRRDRRSKDPSGFGYIMTPRFSDSRCLPFSQALLSPRIPLG
jgi:hypothetical protein